MEAQSALLGLADVLELPVTMADTTISYGADKNQFGALRLPKGEGPHPVVVGLGNGIVLVVVTLGAIEGQT